MASLRISGVSVAFDAVGALEDVSIDVAAGEWLALIGPNGAGKTTLLKAIAAALPLSAGSVLLEQDDVSAMHARTRARRIAVVPQEQALPAGWTVQQVVEQGRAPHLGTWRSERQQDRDAVSGALQATATTAMAFRCVETLSGGERQRVLLARALAQTPRVLLLDEPTAFLDLQYQWEMLEYVELARRERGITVISVLHDLNLTAAFADRIALLKSGRVMAVGSPEEVLTEGTIRRGYNRRVSISTHPATGRPTVVSWPSERRSSAPLRIHIISGGGTGASLMRHLISDGHSLSAGVLNVGDTDWETARILGIEVAEEAPFSAISEQAYRSAEALTGRADVVIFTDTAVGPGNLDNLSLAISAAGRGQRVLLVGSMTPERDFTGGRACSLWEEALESGAILCREMPDAVRALEVEVKKRLGG